MNCEPYRLIEQKTGVSAGSIHNIIVEETRRSPDLPELRNTLELMKKHNLSPLDIKRDTRLLESLNTYHLTIKNVEEATKLLQKYFDDASEVLEHGVALSKIEDEQRRPYYMIIQELQLKLDEKEKAKSGLQTINEEISQTLKQLKSLKKLEDLQGKLDAHEITHDRLDDIILEKIQLESLGFTPHVAKTLSEELKRQGNSPEQAAFIVAKLISNSSNLTKENRILEDRYSQLVNAVKELELRKQSLQTEIDSQVNTKKSLNSLITEQDKLAERKNAHLDEQQVQIDYNKVEINEIQKILGELDKKVAIYENQLIVEEPINVVTSLLHNSKINIEPVRLYTAILVILSQLNQHIKQYPQSVNNLEALSTKLNETIRLVSEEKFIDQRKSF